MTKKLSGFDKVLLVGGLYVVGSQLHKESVTSKGIARAKSLGGNILDVGAVGIGNLISRTATIEGSTRCDIQPSQGMDYCNIAQAMPYENKQFNVVFASHVLEHIKPQEVQNALSEFQRIGTHVIIVLPHPFALAFYLAKGHQSQITKNGNVLTVRNNFVYNSVSEHYTIKFDPQIIEVFQ